MHQALEVLADNFLPRFFLGHHLHLTCKGMYSRSLQGNLIGMFGSFAPKRCQSTFLLRHHYPKIDSSIPYVSSQELCVLGRATPGVEGMNDVCVVGKTSEVVSYFLELLSVGISFASLEVYPSKVFSSKRYLDLGYGKKVGIGSTNVVCFLGGCTDFIPQKLAPREAALAGNRRARKAWNRR